MGVKKETYIENIVSPVCYLPIIVMLVAAIIVPFGLEGLAVNAGLATETKKKN